MGKKSLIAIEDRDQAGGSKVRPSFTRLITTAAPGLICRIS